MSYSYLVHGHVCQYCQQPPPPAAKNDLYLSFFESKQKYSSQKCVIIISNFYSNRCVVPAIVSHNLLFSNQPLAESRSKLLGNRNLNLDTILLSRHWPFKICPQVGLQAVWRGQFREHCTGWNGEGGNLLLLVNRIILYLFLFFASQLQYLQANSVFAHLCVLLDITLLLWQKCSYVSYTVKKGFRFSRPQPGCY